MPDGVVIEIEGQSQLSPEDQATHETQQAFLSKARKRFKTVANAEAMLRKRMLEDLEFRASDQWYPQDVADRERDGRPCITVNRLPQFIRQVTNAQRTSSLAIKVAPVDDLADKETAEIFAGMVRHIEYQSDAQVAYSTGGDHQATMGRGWWRIVSEFENEKSFRQALRIKRVRNPFMVYQDPSAQEADGSDASYTFVVEDVPKDEAKARYGDEALKGIEIWETLGDQGDDWMPTGKVRIAEYWYVEEKKEDLYLIRWPSGREQSIFKSAWDKYPESYRQLGVITEERVSDRRQVKMALINGVHILEGNEDKTEGKEWPGKWIPIIPVIGDEIDINGKVDLRGMVRDAKGPQRLYNFQNTALAEALAVAPKAPFVGYVGQFEGQEEKWREANRRMFPYLEVNPVTAGGQIAPLPQRMSSSADISGIMAAIHQSDGDMKAVMGLYEPSLGSRGQAESGKAINALKASGELANSNFIDNMGRAIRATGRQLVDLIPHYYSEPQVIRIMGDDRREKSVMVHAGAPQDKLPNKEELPEGVSGIFDLSAGMYDVTVSVGPSFDTQRQEAFASLSQFVQAYPASFPILGDLIMGAMDWPGAEAAQARLERLVPPEAKDETDGGPPPIPPEVQQQMQQMAQQAEELAQKLEEAQKVISSKQVEMEGQAQLKQMELGAEAQLKQLELESKEKLENLKGQIALVQTLMRTESAEGIAQAKNELAHLQQLLQHKHDETFEGQKLALDVAKIEAEREDRQLERQEERVDKQLERQADRVDADLDAQRQSELADEEAMRAEAAETAKATKPAE